MPVEPPRRPPEEPTNPIWGPDWPSVREHWLLDPAVAFLNHGSFGACPRPVLDAQDRWREELERRPVEFLWRRLPGLLDEAADTVAASLGADPDGFAFVRNATAGVATVLANAGLGPGDRLVLTDHAYPAVLAAARRVCRETGAELALAEIPLPLPEPAGIVERFVAALTPTPKLAVIEHVTSATAAFLPVHDLVAACRTRGIPVLVDGAHAPGMVPVDLDGLRPDYWTGNFHKWVCAPKGSAGLFVGPDHRAEVRPLLTSHGIDAGYRDRFHWLGTDDPTPWLSTPDALAFLSGLGWDRVRSHNHDLAVLGRGAVSAAAGTPVPVPDGATGSMALTAIPDGLAATDEDAARLQRHLYDSAAIEVPVGAREGRGYLRLSAQAYNHPGEYERLAEAIAALAGGPPAGVMRGDSPRR